ncbi:MAG: nitroreductase family protein [Alphaproteobacteria bacterium]|nr:nitroreductase family protein [Alphaproteobacteria bacterium]
MATRRSVLIGALGASALAAGGGGLWFHVARGSAGDYEARARSLRTVFDPENAGDRLWAEIVRYATLAANSHNTQAWRFGWDNGDLAITPDGARRTPAVDPDDHHLYASLGCALENMLLAGQAAGLRLVPRFADGAIRVALEPAKPATDWLFDAIPHRQSTRGPFDGSTLSAEEQRLLEETPLGGGVEGVVVRLFTDRPAIAAVREYVIEGNTRQMADAAFVAELRQWIRFGYGEALRTGDGLFGVASGNPALPEALGSLIFSSVFTLDGETEKYRTQIDGSAAIAVLSAATDDPAGWVQAGRAVQRLQLAATAMGLKTSYINQPVEVAALRGQFAAWAGLGARRPDLVLRIGRGAALPYSLRRPVEAVYGG